MRKLVSLAVIATSLYTGSVAAQPISIPGGSAVAGWGIGGIQSVGQTFVASGPLLNDFSFWLRTDAPPPFSFYAYVFAWDEGTFRATGPALYVSPLQASPPPLPGFMRYTFAPTLPVVAGNRYVAFMSALLGVGGLATIESTAIDSYAGGSYVYTNQPPMLFQWNSYTGVAPSPPPRDLRFEANFSAVPEPSSVALVAAGLTALGAAASRRRRGSTG